jgi:hypothetical protein
MFGLPVTWLAGAAAVCVGLFFGAVQLRHNAKLAAAHSTGVAVGKAESAATALASASKTAQAEREATEATPLPADKQAIIELCRKSASCRDRGKR